MVQMFLVLVCDGMVRVSQQSCMAIDSTLLTLGQFLRRHFSAGACVVVEVAEVDRRNVRY
jgi:hypothetical protein